MKLNIQIFGLGFVGLTTALALSKMKFRVHGVENDNYKLESLKKKKLYFYEPHLKDRLKIEIKKKYFSFSNNYFISKKKVNIFFICVGTPDKKNGEADINYIENIIKNLKKKITDEKILLVIKSTVPPGTADLLKKKYNAKNLHFISNPEFLREGTAWNDFFYSGKIIIGCNNNFSKIVMNKIYKKFNDPIIFTNNNTAEFIKYLSNTLLATLISFSNEMTMFAEKFGNINIKESFNALKLDKRWNGRPCNISSYLHPGIGYGGYCLPKDVKALNYLISKFKKKNILKFVNKINEEIFYHQVNKITKSTNKNIFILGLSFKPNSDDIRQSTSIKILKYLEQNSNKKIYACDFFCYEQVRKIFPKKISITEHPFLKKNTSYVLCTAHKEYIPFLKKIKKEEIIDLRYLV